MSNSPIKMPFELKQLCEQMLSHMQLAAACGDAEGAARQAEKLIDVARSLRDAFLPADHPRCDQCAEPLSAIEAQSGEHCRQCSLLMSMGAQIEKIRLKNLVAQQAATSGLPPAATKDAPPVTSGLPPAATKDTTPVATESTTPVAKKPAPVKQAAPKAAPSASGLPPAATKPAAAPPPVQKQSTAKPVKGRKPQPAQKPPASKPARPESIQLELAVR